MTEQILLTPGPLTTSLSTRSAMLMDWGSWDGAFNALTASVNRDLIDIVQAHQDHVCVPLQGSGTFAVEAALGTLVTANASCESWVISAATPSYYPMANNSPPTRRASMMRWRPIPRSLTSRKCIAKPARES
jgi:hypothetical protein